LFRYLSEHFLSEDIPAHLYVFLEAHKLYYISGSLPTCLASEKLMIRIELAHHLEFVIAHTNNDDTHGEAGGLVHDQVDCLVHVMDLPIGKDEEDVIYLAGELGMDYAQHLYQDI
jgi:hypothetical protein